jgi:hypothetical protein
VRSRERLLIAAQPAPWQALKSHLEAFELVHVMTTSEAFRVLAESQFDVIVCTIAFDDSRMLDFLQAAKRSATVRGIPFICCRVLSSVLPDELVASVGATCRACGAADFLDIARMTPRDAGRSMRRAVNAQI